MRRVLGEMDITILCGHRTREEQDDAFNGGFSKVRYPNSKHNKTPSQAVDVAPYPIDWNNLQKFRDLSTIVKRVWSEMTTEEKEGWNLHWGGDFKNFVDMPHWELRR
jgi:hypothetical protein